MRKNCYYRHKKHYCYFSLYYSFIEDKECNTPLSHIHIVASKRGVHQKAVKRNFAKRRLRAALNQFLKSNALPENLMLKIVAKKEVLDCSFEDLSFMLGKSLKAISL